MREHKRHALNIFERAWGGIEAMAVIDKDGPGHGHGSLTFYLFITSLVGRVASTTCSQSFVLSLWTVLRLSSTQLRKAYAQCPATAFLW
jgi:hypothetical protein